MPNYRATVRTTCEVQQVFDYMANFDNTREWDPGVQAARRTTPSPLGVGSRFQLDFKLGPTTTELSYEIRQFDPPRSLTLVADNGWLVSHDRIEIAPTPAGATVTYDATVKLKGPLRLAEPLLAVGFRRACDRALAGLRHVLPA